MKYFSILFCLFLLCCTSGCKKHTNDDSSNIEIIHVDVNNSTSSIDLSPFLQDEVDIIALETNDSCLVSEILKVEFYEDNIFISDRTSKCIYRFASSGKFINKIGQLGGGPEEYVSLGDFNVIDDLIYLHDERSGTGKIIVYAFDGTFIKTITPSIAISFDEFVNIDNKLFFVTNYTGTEIGYYNIYDMDLSTGKMNGFLPYDKSIESEQQKWGLNKFISGCKNSALVIFSNNDLIYSISSGEINPKYKVQFSDRNLPKEEIKKGGTHAMATALSKGYILGMENINNSENYLFFTFSDGSKGRSVFYDKVNKKNYVSDWLIVKSLGDLYGTGCFTSNNEFAIIQDAYLYRHLWEGQYSEFGFKSEKDKQRMLDIYNSIIDDDNPVLFRFKFKNNN